MTPTECQQWINRCRLVFKPVASLFEKLPSDSHRQSLAEEWLRTVETIDRNTAHLVVDRIHAGEIDAPKFDWSLLPGIVRREASSILSTRSVDAPRYKCNSCRGSGLVELINPIFVQQYPTIEDAQQEFGEAWVGKANTWWRAERQRAAAEGTGRGPLLISAICDCEAAETKRDRLREYWDCVSAGHSFRGSTPAHQVIYDKERHTTKREFETGNLSEAQTLEEERKRNPLAGFSYPE